MSKEIEAFGLVPVKKRPGRPRKVDSPTVAPEVKKKPILPVLKVDLTADPAEQLIQISERDQARHLGWKVAEVRSVNSNLGLYESLPMMCRASGCHWASMCPTRPDYKFKGYLCPLEMMDVYRFFLGYVIDLDIAPTDYVDLRLVEDLVRIDLQLKRVDQQISVFGMEVDTVGGVIQSAGTAVWEKGAHPLLVIQDKLRNRRRDIHKALIAARDVKFERDRKEGKAAETTLDWISRMMSGSNIAKSKAYVKESADTIDGEVLSDEDESEEYEE